jgi:hypothetical protein
MGIETENRFDKWAADFGDAIDSADTLLLGLGWELRSTGDTIAIATAIFNAGREADLHTRLGRIATALETISGYLDTAPQ